VRIYRLDDSVSTAIVLALLIISLVLHVAFIRDGLQLNNILINAGEGSLVGPGKYSRTEYL